MDALLELLREDAVMTMPPQADLEGAQAIIAFFAGSARSTPPRRRGSTAPPRSTSNRDGSPHRLLVLDVGEELVDGIAVYEPKGVT